MKKLFIVLFALLVVFGGASSTKAQGLAYPSKNYTIQAGDSLWKIAVKNQVGVSEIKSYNPQISNPNMIITGKVIKVPDLSAIIANENEVVRLVNVERSKVGQAPLKANWQLSRVARYKSEDMRDKKYFSHTSPTYGSPFDMMKNFGLTYSAAGENIAMGQVSPAEVMKSWMNSPGHKQNILSPNYTEIGVGYASGSYWDQMFIGR